MSGNIDKLKAVFLGALEQASAGERAAFLDEACASDAALRHGVETLLRAHDRIDPLLDRAAAEHLDGLSDERPGPDDSLGFLATSTRPDSLGRLGQFEVLEVLGKGGSGIVLRAFDGTLQRVVAVKVLAPQLAVMSPARKRFLREARSSARIRHENVVQIYAVEEQPLPYLVMELIPGETLQERCDRMGPLELPEVLWIGRQIAEGLAAAHATGLVHRDVKPANVLIERGPHKHAKLTDFGLARAADDASVSQSGLVAGTPMYMAPEQARGDRLDHRADLFSLGSVLYLMGSGRPPFRAKTALAVLKRVAEDEPRPIREIIPETPEWLCNLISRLHAKKPEDRFASAREVADLLTARLDQLLHEATVEAPSLAPPAPGEKRPPDAEIPAAAPAFGPRFRGHRWAAAAAAVLLLSGGLGFTEATGVTHVTGTVIRLFSPEGTLVVGVDDPGIGVKMDGSDLVITGTGVNELRLKPGSYTVEARKDGKVVSRELVSVTKDGRQVVRVRQEAGPPGATAVTAAADAVAWESAVSVLSADEQAKAVGARLKELNPGFDGDVSPTILQGVVTGLQFRTSDVVDIGPLRALKGLASLNCSNSIEGMGKLSDLSPLHGMPLSFLDCSVSQVSDLTALNGLPLRTLCCQHTQVSDLAPLRGMPLEKLCCDFSKVSDLSPLKDMRLRVLEVGGLPISELTILQGMPLEWLNLAYTKGVKDLTPLRGIRLVWLNLAETSVSDLSPLKGMASLKTLIADNSRVSDLSPLNGLELETIRLTPRNITQGLEILRDMRTLKTIGIGHNQSWPAAEFWDRYDKGEFR
jgi:hypothetical protein